MPAFTLTNFLQYGLDIQEAIDTRTAAPANTRPRTPDQILGPFYPVTLAPDTTGDLTANGAKGQILYVTGRVLSTAGEPVVGARVEIWQANAVGRYRHPNDDSTHPLDPAFNGYALLTTGADGSYRLKTIRPASYETSPGNFRPAHLHFTVTSQREQLTTQMYFEGDAHNATDPFLQSARRKEMLVVTPTAPLADMDPGSEHVQFDIVLMRG